MRERPWKKSDVVKSSQSLEGMHEIVQQFISLDGGVAGNAIKLFEAEWLFLAKISFPLQIVNATSILLTAKRNVLLKP